MKKLSAFLNKNRKDTRSIEDLLDEIDRQVASISDDTDENHVLAAQAYAFDAELDLVERGVSISDAVALVDLDILKGVTKS
jgi:hypothetical protein